MGYKPVEPRSRDRDRIPKAGRVERPAITVCRLSRAFEFEAAYVFKGFEPRSPPSSGFDGGNRPGSSESALVLKGTGSRVSDAPEGVRRSHSNRVACLT